MAGQPWWVNVLVGYAAAASFFLVVCLTLMVWAELERRRASRARRRRARARGGGIFGDVAAGDFPRGAP